MALQQDIELDMPICYDGMVRGVTNDKPIDVYRMKINSEWTWFNGTQNYEPDGNQFTIAVSYFGIKRKTLVGSTGNQFRHVYSQSMKEIIEKRIKGYFLGPEQKPFFPFNHPLARCIGVQFKSLWILTS